ncbi:unnamed protein product, partial [Brassica oleracea]
KIDGKALPNSPKTQPATLCSLSEISVKLRFWRGVYGQILKI